MAEQEMLQRRMSDGHASFVPSLQEQAKILLQAAFPWFEKMVDERTNRFYSIARPDGRKSHEDQPIRDLAAVWNAQQLQQTLHRSSATINNAILATTSHYVQNQLQVGIGQENPVWKILPDGERPHIGHSAGLIRALLASAHLSDDADQHLSIARGLATEILKLRDSVDGHFDIAFDRRPMGGHEFDAGDAIHALALVFPERVADLVTSHGTYMEMLREGRFVTETYFCNWLAKSGDALHTAAIQLAPTPRRSCAKRCVVACWSSRHVC